MRNVISTKNAPQAIGPYSQAIAVEGTLLFTAGQIAMDPATGHISAARIEEQTRQALDNLKAVVEAGGSSLSSVVKVTVFLKDMNDFATVNEIYAEYFGDDPPARSAIEVARLPKDVLIEVECIARIES